MSDMPTGDPYVENVLARVPGEVARTLSSDQWDGIRSALNSAYPAGRHVVDVRFVLPLYFTRIYCVFIMGKDRRQRVEHVLVERRRRAGLLALAGGLAAGLVFGAGAVFVILYLAKSAAGIDLIPGFHLGW